MERKALYLLENLLETIQNATLCVNKDQTDCGVVFIPELRWEPSFEFTEEDIEVMKWLEEQSDYTVDFSVLRNNK